MNRRNLFKTLLGLGAGAAAAKLVDAEDLGALKAALAEGPAMPYEQFRNTLGLCQTSSTSGHCEITDVQWAVHVSTVG